MYILNSQTSQDGTIKEVDEALEKANFAELLAQERDDFDQRLEKVGAQLKEKGHSDEEIKKVMDYLLDLFEKGEIRLMNMGN